MSGTDTKKLVNDFIEPIIIEKEFSTASFEVSADNKFVLSLSEKEEGNAGIIYSSLGLAINKDANSFYLPSRARGIGRHFGIYHQAFLESQAYQDGWGKIEQGLVTSYWSVAPAECEDHEQAEYAKRQAKAVERVLFGIDGGWAKHVQEALYMLIGGFSPFLKITDGLGQLKALSFRYPSQVKRWLTDENEQYYLGIEFSGGSAKYEPYIKLADELLLYQFRALGNDFEGISPMRSVMVYIEAQKLFVRLEAVAAEKFGAPYISVERAPGSYDSSADEQLIMTLDSFVATDGGVILLPGGYKINVSSPQGQMPNFESVKRYCDEKISSMLSAEGSLIGLNGKGAYNLAEIKDDQQLRSLAYYGLLICNAINSKSPAGHQSLIQHIVHHLKDVDGEDLSMTINGEYPKLTWALSPSQDDTNIEQVISAFERGVIEKTPEDEAWLRERLKVPAQVIAKPAPEVPNSPAEALLGTTPSPDGTTPADATEKAADTALNGAQAASAVSIVQAAAAGSISERSAIEILKMVFLISEEQAVKILNLTPDKAPAPGEKPLVIAPEVK